MASWQEKVERARLSALDAFHRIQNARPDLEMTVDLEPDYVEATVDIPVQSGLAFPVHLNLQNNDELHLQAAEFWLEWFPCDDPDVADRYVDSVVQLLNGRYRILQLRRGARLIGADLQAPTASGGWQTIGRYRSMSLLPWPPVSRTAVQNIAAPSSEGT